MNAWGDGNFDNDAAMEYLATTVEHLVDTVEHVLSTRGRAALSTDGEGILMPSVELIALLCERYGCAAPRAKTVEQWKKKYLKAFDGRRKPSKKPDPDRDARRKVIERTFDWLSGLARS